MSDQSRVPKGVSQGGQFAASAKAESASDLSVELDGWAPETSYPYPQANNLELVANVPAMVDAGATTPDAIAEALGVSGRQGGYYANAAAYLGLVETDPAERCQSFRPTVLGDNLARAAADERARLMRAMVSRIEDVQYVSYAGPDALTDALSAAEMAPETALRRAACMKSWADASSAQEQLASAIAASSDAAAPRITAAVQRAQAQRDAARAAASEPEVRLCNGCFIALPVTGVCDDCS